MYIAHINNRKLKQSCSEHCKNAADLASERMISIGLKQTGYLAGVLHDAGKCSKEFEEYIIAASEGKNVKKGSVIHSFTGCAYLLRKEHTNGSSYEDITAEIIAYAIAAHHGLFDCIDEFGGNGYSYRVNKQPEYDSIALSNFFAEVINEFDVLKLFKDATEEIRNKCDAISALARDDSEISFYIGLLTRTILAGVIDGDRTDTVRFMSGLVFKSDTTIVWSDIYNNLLGYLQDKPCNTPIQVARGELSVICDSFAENLPGVYRLSLPTGAGKTLSSMRYAVKHAMKYNKTRILYIAPLISILEQNAAVIREAVGDAKLVLEHHSNVIRDSEPEDESNVQELLIENWDAPIIITTLVQFLNTLFSGKTSAIRRFVSLNDSIIILDEVQTVPWKMLSLFNLAINYLSNICNATVILCSATQPELTKIPHGLIISEKEFLSKEQKDYYYKVFKRSRVEFDGEFCLSEIPAYVIAKNERSQNTLIICNKKKEAEYIFKTIRDAGNKCYHLSAAMCQEHRKQILQKIYESIEKKEHFICVATQVIEAGVDISFQTVVRIKTGMDSVIQSQGRCNRNGEMEGTAITYLIGCIDEDLKRLEEIKKATDATNDLIVEFSNESEKFDYSLDSDESIIFYYQALYRDIGYTQGYLDYMLPTYPTLYSLLSENEQFSIKCRQADYYMRQAFKLAGSEFEALDTNTISILVPYGQGREIVTELCSNRVNYDYRYVLQLLSKAKLYTVSIQRYLLEILKRKGAVGEIYNGTILVLDEKYYDKDTGISEEEVNECSTLIL